MLYSCHLKCDIYCIPPDQYQDYSTPRHDTQLSATVHARRHHSYVEHKEFLQDETNYQTARCHTLTVALRQDSYSSPNIIRNITRAGHAARIGQKHVGFGEKT